MLLSIVRFRPVPADEVRATAERTCGQMTLRSGDGLARRGLSRGVPSRASSGREDGASGYGEDGTPAEHGSEVTGRLWFVLFCLRTKARSTNKGFRDASSTKHPMADRSPSAFDCLVSRGMSEGIMTTTSTWPR